MMSNSNQMKASLLQPTRSSVWRIITYNLEVLLKVDYGDALELFKSFHAQPL